MVKSRRRKIMNNKNEDRESSIFSNLLSSSIEMHEMYITYVKAGFKEKEALFLLANMVVAFANSNNKKDEGC